MGKVSFLIIFPIIISLILLIIKKEKYRSILIKVSIILIGICSILFAFQYYNNPDKFYFINSQRINYLILFIEALMTLYIISLCTKYKKIFIGLLSLVQWIIMLCIEVSCDKTKLILDHHIFIDKLSIIMVLIIAIVGGSICIYAISYMEDFHRLKKEVKDRRRTFFANIFIFFSGMFGIVLSNDLIWIYFFWEVTTLCSFLLIGYTQTKEAINNSFIALLMNSIGGVCFAIAVAILIKQFNIYELKTLSNTVDINSNLILSISLIAIAALSKAAQLPFSKWLLGAMVAPTPTSALLHSSTMVKAGVYLLIRISPVLSGNISGEMVTLVGGLTFLVMSLIAISQSDAKKILAYSTMSNLGLIVACAGIGTYESIWAAILLLIFHSVSKSLMFLSVGATEHIIGSRDIEDMHGLIIRLPEMALMMAIGIAGMFLAPFGMLISKWAALKAFVDSRHVIIVLALAYGSAATLFYWTKWLGKLTAIRHKWERQKCTVKRCEWEALILQAIITISLCVLYPIVSKVLIIPFISEMFNITEVNLISNINQTLLTIMLGVIIILPFGMRFFTSRGENIVPVYMSGINSGDDKNFYSAYGEKKNMYLSSWYMENIFGEKKLLPIGIYISLILIIGFFTYTIGGVL